MTVKGLVVGITTVGLILSFSPLPRAAEEQSSRKLRLVGILAEQGGPPGELILFNSVDPARRSGPGTALRGHLPQAPPPGYVPQCRPDSSDGHLQQFQSALAKLVQLPQDLQIDARLAGIRDQRSRPGGGADLALQMQRQMQMASPERTGALSAQQLDTYAADLVQRPADIIVTVGTPATLAASRATKSIPIVMLGVSDPVRSGLAHSLARPGGNITGLSLLGPALMTKQLDFLAEVTPTVKNVAILWNPTNAGAATAIAELSTTARQHQITLLLVGMRNAGDVTSAIDTLNRSQANALLVVNDPAIAAQASLIMQWAQIRRIPTMFQSRDWLPAGGLLAYEPDFCEMEHRAASYVSKILNGERPATLPIEQPTKFQLTINRTTAWAIGLQIPQSLLLQANQVIE